MQDDAEAGQSGAEPVTGNAAAPAGKPVGPAAAVGWKDWLLAASVVAACLFAALFGWALHGWNALKPLAPTAYTQRVFAAGAALQPAAVSVYEPTYAGYAGLSEVAFPQYNVNRTLPFLVFAPKSASEVQRILQTAVANAIRVSVRGGGHNYAGWSQVGTYNTDAAGAAQSSATINMRNLDAVTLVEDWNGFGPALRIGAGATFSQVYTAMGPPTNYFDTYSVVGGMCPTVGVAGFYLGGGLGYLTRKYGMGSDNVLQLTLVLANGSDTVVANSTTHADLYWALRGGGGPSFGVVTEFVVQLHPVASTSGYTFGELCGGNTTDTIRAGLGRLANYTATDDFPDWLTVDPRLVKRVGIENADHTGLCYLIYSLANYTATLDALRPILFGNETGVLGNFTTYQAMVAANAAAKNYQRVAQWPVLNRAYVIGPMNASIIDVWVGLYDALPTNCYIQALVMSGPAVARLPTNATAFPYRGRVTYAADSECDVTPGQEAAIDAHLASYVQRMAPYALGGYLNFPWNDLPDYGTAYWGDNYPRLRQIRQAYNPLANANNPLYYPKGYVELP